MAAYASEAVLAISELEQLFMTTTGLVDVLDGLAVLAASNVAPGVSCGITIVRENNPATVASSDARASQVDEIQYAADAGPCLHAMKTGETVRIDNMSTDDRWVPFNHRAAQHGIGSSLSQPLIIGDRSVGALNLYGSGPNTFGPSAEQRAAGFAREVAAALAVTIRMADQSEITEQLRAALASRSVIDQAIGVVMAQSQCNAETAFRVLRKASQNRNHKLRDVAVGILTSTGGPPSPAPPFH